jgi:hypothetical protein
MPTGIRLAHVALAGLLAAVCCGVPVALAELNSGGRTSTTSAEADAANGLPTGRRTYHPQLLILSDELASAGATTAQFAGGRQPAPPQPV